MCGPTGGGFLRCVAGIPLAAFGYLSSVVADAAIPVSSVSVIGNVVPKRWMAGKSGRADKS